MFAVGVKLRRVGPIMLASARLLYCQAALRLVQGGRGEVFAVAGASATRPWCGPGGYIQVGMRGCDFGEGIRAPRGRSPLSMHSLLFWKFCLLSRLPLPGGRDARGLGTAAAACLSSTCGGCV